jgi:hypothetical protein
MIVMRTHGQKNMHEGETLMGTARQRRRGWRASKAKRKAQKSSKRAEAWRPQITNGDESAESVGIDRLLLSSLRLWEVERDLIEERIAALGR